MISKTSTTQVHKPQCLPLQANNVLASVQGWPPAVCGPLVFRLPWDLLVSSSSHRLPWELSSKAPACQCRRRKFNPWVGKMPWRRKWQPTPVFLPGKSHGQRSLVGDSPWGQKESDTTEWLNNNQAWVNGPQHRALEVKLALSACSVVILRLCLPCSYNKAVHNC